MFDNTKKYSFTLPDGRSGVWTEEQMQKGREALYKKYPDAQVMSLTEYNAAQGIDDDAMYVIDTGDGRTSTWDSAQMMQGYDALMAKYPHTKVMRAKQDTYWQDKAVEQTAALNKFDADNDEFFRQHEKDTALYNTGESSRINFDEEGYLERDRQYRDLQSQRQQMEIERANNPYIKAMYESQSRKSDENIARYDEQIAALKSSDNKDRADLRNLRQARKLARDTKDVYDVDVAKSNDGFAEYVRNMGQGAGDVFGDADFWSRGLTSIARNINIHSIEKRLNKDGRSLYDLTEEEIDKELTPTEKDLFIEFIRNASAQAERAGNMARGYTAGQSAAESVGFMAEFIVTAGIAKGIGTALDAAESGLGKWIARELTGKTAEAITSTAGKVAYNAIARPVEKAIFHTALHPTTYSSIAEALTQIDDNGQLVKAGNAIASTILDQFIENWSESIGEPIEKILPPALIAKGAVSETGQKILSKIGKADWAKMWVDSDVHRVLIDAGFNGLVGEMAEEWAGNAVRLSTGLMDKDEFAKFASWDEQVDMMASFAPMSLFGLGSQSVAAHRLAKERNANLALVRDALTRQGWTEQEIHNVLDTAHTKAEIKEMLRPVVNNIVSQRTNGGNVTTDYLAMLDFARINEMGEILDEARKYEREQSRASMRQAIEMGLGATDANPDSGRFSYMVPSVNEDGTTSEQEMVTTITDDAGNIWYLIGQDNAKVILRKKGDTSGQPFFITIDEYDERLADGSYKEYTTTVDEYLDSEVEAQRKAQESRRINDAVTTQYEALNKWMMQNPEINLGTAEAPKIGIIQEVRRDGVIIEFETPIDLGAGPKLIHKISLDGALNALGESSIADTRTDDQIAIDEANREYVQEQRLKQLNKMYRSSSVNVNGEQLTVERVSDLPYNTEDGNEVIKVAARNASGEINEIVVPVSDIQVNEQISEVDNTDVTSDTNLDFRGNPLPMTTTEDGVTQVVDETALWNRDPEAYLRWNDARRNGVTDNSERYLGANIANLTKQMQALDKAQAEDLDPQVWQSNEDKKAALANKINLYQSLLNRYQVERQTKEALAQIQQQTSEMYRKLLMAQTPEQTAEINAKIDALREQYYATIAQGLEGQAFAERKVNILNWVKGYADMPVKTVDLSDVIGIIREDGATESQIEECQAMVNKIFAARRSGKYYVINGFHLNGTIYLFAEGCINEDVTKATFYHEREHEITERDPLILQPVIDAFGGDYKQIESAVEAISGTTVYNGSKIEVLADELVAFSIERLYLGRDAARELLDIGIPEEFINYIIDLYGKQTTDGYRLPTKQNGSQYVGRHSVTGGEPYRTVEAGTSGDGRLDAPTNGGSTDRERIGSEVTSLFENAPGETPIQGLENYTRDELKSIVREYVSSILSENGIESELVDVELHGSRGRGTARKDSDLDAVVEYRGDIREDGMFNLLNAEDSRLVIDGITVDVNPIRAEETGTMASYMERSRRYDAEMAGRPAFRAVPVEGTKNLVAIHNIKEQDLRNAFELGGFPMPSIAITKAEVGHTDFGDISLIFDKNSIDPRNRKNKVYGGDAWTPMFPKIAYKLNYDKTRDIYRRAVNVGELPMFNSSNFNNVNYEDSIDDTGESGLINSFKDDYGAKQFFLAEQGNPVLAYETKEADKYDARTVGMINELLNTIGLENLKKQDYLNVSPEVIDLLRTWFDKLDGKMLNRVGRNYVQKAIDYAENGNKKTEVDYEATRRKIDERVDTVAFEKWLEDMFSGIVEKRGIRNEVDLFTPSGNRRPFEKLYDDITLDNVVKAMSRAPEKGGSGFFHGNIFGAASGTFGSLAQIREAAKQRIGSIEPSEMEKYKNAILDRLSNVRVTDKKLDITEMFDLKANIQDAVAKTHTPEGIYRYLKEFYPDTTLEAAQEIADIIKDIQQLSTRYFEAKPYRAVGFDEVKLAVVPEGTSQDIFDGLRERGVDVRTYTDGDQEQRKQVVADTAKETGLNFRINADERKYANENIDKAIAFVRGISVKEASDMRKDDERRIKEKTTELYSKVLDNQFDDITLQLIDEFIANVTPNNPYRQPLSKRLPPSVGRRMRGVERNNAVDGLFTRIAESTVREAGSSVERTRARREAEEKKKELLKGWAIATGNWHTSVSDFTDNTEPIGKGKDSVVYNSNDGNNVIKVSFGKNKEKKFSPDIDAVNLFNAVFPNTRYEILGYGEIDGKFVKFLKQPSVRFSENPTVSVEDRIDYMRNLGFEPINKEKSAFSNGELVVADVQKGNIVRDVNGKIRVIDADVKLHTKDIGGNYTYPPASDDILPLSGGISFRTANENQQVFISNTLASLDKIPMKSGNAQAWINRIQQAGGLKKEEDKWIGLTDWLKEQDGNISKDDVAEYVREHQVRIEDMNYGESVVFVKDRLAKKYGDIVNEAFQMDEEYGEGNIYVKDLDKAIEFYNSQNTITPILDSLYMDEDGEVDQRAMEDTLIEWMSGIASEVASENENKETDPIIQEWKTYLANKALRQEQDRIADKRDDEITEEELALMRGNIYNVGDPRNVPDNTNLPILDETITPEGRLSVSPAPDNEMDEIIDKAKKDGTYLKALNGKDTKLSPEQWVMVRTEQFKKWFGDWELAAKILNIVTVGQSHGFKNFDEAKKWAKENIVRILTNEETGGKGEIRISNNAISKFLSESAISKSDSKDVHLSVLKVLPDVIRESIDVEQHSDYKKGEDGIRSIENGANKDVMIHRLYGAVSIDGKLYRTKITVKEYKDKNRPQSAYSYEATKIELFAGTLVGANSSNPSTNNSISAANLLNGIEKSYSPGEKLINSSKVVDENGEPMVVYHGFTGNDFNVFDKDIAAENSRSSQPVYGAFFFSDNKDNASAYGTKSDNGVRSLNGLKEVFLKADNPFVVDANGEQYHSVKAYFKERDTGEINWERGGIVMDGNEVGVQDITIAARDLGYDSVIFKNIDDPGSEDFVGKPQTTIAVFSPTQIKSADAVTYDDEGNVIPLSKRFNLENNDIRFRTSEAIEREYPNWMDNQVIEEGKKGQSTQIAGTLGTYKKVGSWIKANLPEGASVLDASSGMGLGTQELKAQGINIEDVEPYPSSERMKSNPPTYTSYTDIKKKYDYIISNAVLNVIPDDWRADVLNMMARSLADGGKMFINTRKAGEEKNIKNRIELDSPTEVLVGTPERITSYQKFFSPDELKDYVSKSLGEGYRVEKATPANSGTSGLAAVVVTKDSGVRFSVTELKEAEETPKDTSMEPDVAFASLPIGYAEIQNRLKNEGLAEVGDEDVSDIMMSIFSNSDESVRNDIINAAPRFDYSLSKATGDYFSSLALKESLSDSEIAAVGKMRDIMRNSIGMDNLSAADALWMMYRTMNPISNDVFDIAKDTEVAARLGHSAQGIQARRQAEDAVRMSVTEAMHSQSAAEMYNQAVAYWKNRLKEGYVDMFESVNDLMASMEKATGVKAEEFEDIRIALNQQSSKALNRMKKYTSDYLEPLWQAIADVVSTANFHMDEVVRYVELKHALERNVVFAKRDAIAYHTEEHDSLVKPLKEELKDLKKQLKDAIKNGDVNEQTRINDRINTVNADIADHDNDLARKLNKVDNGTDTKYLEFREKDYAGLTGMFSEYPGLLPRNRYKTDEEYNKAARKLRQPKFDNLRDMENEAQFEIDVFENAIGKDQVDNLWQKINAATKETLRSQYASGLLSKSQYESVSKMFKYYVPLRGFKDDVAEDIWSYYSSAPVGSFSVPIITAKGRTSEADNPFLWIGTMASSAIAQNVKNESKLALYYYAMNNPGQDLVKVQDMWYELDAAETARQGHKVFVAAYPPLTAGMAPADAVDAYNTWEESMRQKASIGQAYTRHGKFSTNGEIAFIDDKKKAEHFIRLKANGRDVLMFINGSPRAAQAVNGLLNVENTKDVLMSRWLLRLMSSFNTSWNPEFWISNMQRDLIFSIMSMDIKGDGMSNFRRNLITPVRMMRLAKAYENGTLDSLEGKDNKYANYYREFADGGAITGYTVVKGNEMWEKEIDRWMKSNGVNYTGKGKDSLRGVKNVVSKFFGKFNELGEAVEQISRFSAFVSAREAGKSIANAVSDAKELTVNFNRKGSGNAIEWSELDQLTKADGTRLNMAEKAVVYAASLIPAYGRRFVMFFNAAIQGLNTMYNLWKTDKRKTTKWMSGYFAMGALQALIHAMLDDDDDYLNIPEYTRRANAMIGAGGIYFKWALPQEARLFYATGDILVQRALGNEKERGALPNISQGALDIINQALDLSPINPAGGITDILPSIAQPFVENIINKDFTGANVYYENKYLTEDERARTPKFTNTKRGTSGWAINAAKLINYISGGDKDDAGALNWHPESIQNIIEGIGGGTLTTIGKIGDTVTGLAGQGDLTVRRTLFLNRLFEFEGERNQQYHTNELYRFYKGEAEHTKTKLKKYKKAGDFGEQADLMGSEDYEIYLIFERYQKMLEPYEEQLKIEESSEEKRILNREMDALKREMIHEISNL